MATTDTTEGTLTEWRTACFEELGFSAYRSRQLANVKEVTLVRTRGGVKRYEAPLHHLKVAKLLEAGATLDQVIKIFI